jgi:hypothetical protein
MRLKNKDLLKIIEMGHSINYRKIPKADVELIVRYSVSNICRDLRSGKETLAGIKNDIDTCDIMHPNSKVDFAKFIFLLIQNEI